MKPRYSIIRVEGLCPLKLERKLNCDNRLCKDCKIIQNYGDNKQQLVAKVQQALFKSIFTEQLQKVVAIEEQKRIYKQYRPMAEKVVEFLGVKE